MIPQDEEKFLHEQYQSLFFALENKKRELRDAQTAKNMAEHQFEQVKQAIKDYMLGNGIIETDVFILMETEVCEVADVNALPEEYLRTKIIKEANKVKIKAERPDANWYAIVKNTHIKLKEQNDE
jgi:hypothetical protein